MQKQIFPKEIVDHTVEVQVARHSTRSQLIYMMVIFVLVAAFASLPFIDVDVTVRSAGLVRPVNEVTTISSPSSGRLFKLNVQNNQHVFEGDTLFIIESNILDNRVSYLHTRRLELLAQARDLKRLISGFSISAFNNIDSIETAPYRQEYLEFTQRVNEGNARYLLAKKKWKRNRQLFDVQAIAEAEYDNSKFEYDRITAEFKMMHQSHISNWQMQLQNNEDEIADISNQLAQLREEQNDYIIKAPVSGTIQGSDGIFEGVQIFANQSLMKISPDSELVVETYISPGDIGFLKEGMPAKFQIDAFNYNQWGLATGTVKEVANDVIMYNDKPVFKVRCKLDQEALQLKNGYSGKLKKGMTLSARFIVSRRSLWQLLYDDVDDWLNPARAE
ncbi:Putative protein secretion protein, HlyD family [Fulvivirga imtechensis AK7]|uniref:AprE-like beta-barrel domain-containing protein n=1 Tax=Fulvivirga imtechensis AK7 TaxID=1237149 RepID=L8JTR2_9BACT|nr:HlyD family efflux transporter periplasmic adaptor subunit [Fulvivirga imtechensis]ELR72376.1 Putative protein secretion protein, HlyD family [Fulvivirga imtechensis AK7]